MRELGKFFPNREFTQREEVERSSWGESVEWGKLLNPKLIGSKRAGGENQEICAPLTQDREKQVDWGESDETEKTPIGLIGSKQVWKKCRNGKTLNRKLQGSKRLGRKPWERKILNESY